MLMEHFVLRWAGVALLPFLSLSLVAQITFEFDDLPVVGDVVVRHVDTIPAFGPGPAGAAVAWDFSTATPILTTTTTMLAPSATPHAAAFAGSNLAMVDQADNYLFFSSSATELIVNGIAGDLLGTGDVLTIPFSPTLKVHELPRTFGSNFNDQYFFQVIADGSAFGVNSIQLRHRGNVFDTTDAYGQITTPIGTYDCLRVKTTEFSVDSLWFRLLPFGPYTFLQAIVDTTVSYSWLAKETKLAVADMTLDSLGNARRFTYSAIPPAITTGMLQEEVVQVQVHPLPATDGFTVEVDRAGHFRSIEVLGMDGRLHRSMAMDAGTRQYVDTNGWPPGMYMLRLLPAGMESPVVRRVLVQ
jgi:hypothetical protein